MENQHRKISGYRELSQEEIDLMNKIKAFGPQLEELTTEIFEYLANQADKAYQSLDQKDWTDWDRIESARPSTWAETGTQRLQEGLMFLTRAIAQPTFF